MSRLFSFATVMNDFRLLWLLRNIFSSSLLYFVLARLQPRFFTGCNIGEYLFFRLMLNACFVPEGFRAGRGCHISDIILRDSLRYCCFPLVGGVLICQILFML